MATPLPPLTLDELWQELASWAKQLPNDIALAKANVELALDPDHKLIRGCPSHAAAALMAFRDAEKPLVEINAFMGWIRETLSRHPS